MRNMLALAAMMSACVLTGCAESSMELPRTFGLGAMPDSLRPMLIEDCDSVQEHHYTGAMAAPFTAQMQVDCAGLEVFGAKRNVEFLFNDGPLGHLWVMLDSAELAAMDSLLMREVGSVVHATPEYHVYEGGTVALRLAPLELLVATPALMAELTQYRPPTE